MEDLSGFPKIFETLGFICNNMEELKYKIKMLKISKPISIIMSGLWTKVAFFRYLH